MKEKQASKVSEAAIQKVAWLPSSVVPELWLLNLVWDSVLLLSIATFGISQDVPERI